MLELHNMKRMQENLVMKHLLKWLKMLCVPVDIFTVPVLSEPKEYEAASFWMHELAAEL